jgi:hypothetical protein
MQYHMEGLEVQKYVHSIISYGVIFWGNSSHSEEIFKIQK